MSAPGVVTVEEVTGGKARVRFVELPQALHGHDPRWAPPVMAWERYRLDPHRNPYFERGDAVYLLARRLGRPAGRVVAHVAEAGGEGRFGFFTCVDDLAVASALVEAAQAWLGERGCSSMTGPWSFDPTDEPGVLVDGFDLPGTTGRPWRPPWEARLLDELGFSTVADQPTWRLPTGDHADGGADRGAGSFPHEPGDGQGTPRAGDPGQAGPYLDRRLVLPGIAAVPDLSDALRHSSFRTAWRLAKRARAGEWETCTVVRCTTDPSGAVPALCDAAAAAGYRWVVAPWCPDPAGEPEAVHRILRRAWGPDAARRDGTAPR